MEEAQASDRPEGSGVPPFVLGTYGLRSILNYGQSRALGDLSDCLHIARIDRRDQPE
jgi:hypothetical protein